MEGEGEGEGEATTAGDTGGGGGEGVEVTGQEETVASPKAPDESTTQSESIVEPYTIMRCYRVLQNLCNT